MSAHTTCVFDVKCRSLQTRLRRDNFYYVSYTIQQTSSISTCILNTFAGSLLDVCWIV